MTATASTFSTELAGVIQRGVLRMHETHLDDLLSSQQVCLALVRPNQSGSGAVSLEKFATSTRAILEQHLLSIQKFVLDTLNSANTALTETGVQELVSLVRKELHADLYGVRFEVFESALVRRVAQFGGTMQLSDFRNDLTKASLIAGVSNRIMRFGQELGDALLTLMERQRITVHTAEESSDHWLDRVNRMVKLEPSVFGIGLNINYLVRLFRGKKE